VLMYVLDVDGHPCHRCRELGALSSSSVVARSSWEARRGRVGCCGAKVGDVGDDAEGGDGVVDGTGGNGGITSADRRECRGQKIVGGVGSIDA
jgi:hypothetical protein